VTKKKDTDDAPVTEKDTEATPPASEAMPSASQPPSLPARALGWLRTVVVATRERVRTSPRPFLAVAVAVALLVGLVAVDGITAAGKVRHGVRVAGVDLGGLRPDEARQRLAQAAAALAAQPLTVRADAASVSVARGDTGFPLDIPATLDAALAVGRNAPLGLDPDRLRSVVGGVDVAWRTRTDRQVLDGLLERLSADAAKEPEEPSVKVAGSDVRFSPGVPGKAIDRPGAERALAAAVADPAAAEAALPVVTAQPRVTDAAAQGVAAQARQVIAAGIEVTRGSKRANLKPSDLAPALRFTTDGGKAGLTFDDKALDRALRRRAAFAYTGGKDASFKLSGTKVLVVPSVPGKGVDLGEAGKLLLAVGGQTGAARKVELPLTERDPKFTTADAKALGIKQRVATYTTQFDASDAPRVHNIDLIGRALDGKIVRPGQIFSMNEATGERTVAKGYRTAHVLVNGESVEGLGGGVCQAGTTFFNAVFEGGYEITQRTNHSLHLSRYPLGRDATLNWPNKDVKFRNDSKYGILIRAWVRPDSMTVSLYSTSLKTKVTHTTSGTSNFRGVPTRYEDDPTLPAGTERVKASGSAGFDVTVTRTVRRAGKVVHKDTFLSQYMPWHRIILRGTGPGSGETAPPPRG
jgi:vancomycin resistance protein YoaR